MDDLAIRSARASVSFPVTGRMLIGGALVLCVAKDTANAKALPFGGYKNSGIGRERGLQELYSYTESKSIQIYL